MKKILKICFLISFFVIFSEAFADPIPVPPKPNNHMCTSDGKFCQDVNWQMSDTITWSTAVNCPNNHVPNSLYYFWCSEIQGCQNKGKFVYMTGFFYVTKHIVDTPIPNEIMDQLVKQWCNP